MMEEQKKSKENYCLSCNYRNVPLTDDEILKQEKEVIDFVSIRWRLATGDIFMIEKKKDEQVKQRLFDKHVIPFIPIVVEFGFKLNSNFVSCDFKSMDGKATAWVCPRCGAMRVDLGNLDRLEIQHAKERERKELLFYIKTARLRE